MIPPWSCQCSWDFSSRDLIPVYVRYFQPLWRSWSVIYLQPLWRSWSYVYCTWRWPHMWYHVSFLFMAIVLLCIWKWYMYLQLYAELYYCTMLIGWLVFHLGSFVTPLLGWTYNVFRASYDPSDPTHLGASVIADFTTPGESHFVWPSPVPLQTPYTLWTTFCPLMFPLSSLKTHEKCYTQLLNL